MKYIYKIEDEWIIEYLNDSSYEPWHIPYLLKDISQISMNKHLTQSFIRTKKWLQKNHPELLI